jgi:hypothetical protein
MIIKYCTLNGVDDAVNIHDIVRLSKEYPFAEWGVLVDGVDEGSKRFPSKAWIEDFAATTPGVYKSLQITCSRMPDVVEGVTNVLSSYNLNGFQRVLFSFDLLAMPYTLISRILKWAREAPHLQFITQHNGKNQNVWKLFAEAGLNNHAVLFDSSNGTGRTPARWPEPISGIPCGYCGGLSPMNIEDNLAAIAGIIGDGVTWVDMASGLRDDNDEFDIMKAEQVLLFTSRYTLPSTKNL